MLTQAVDTSVSRFFMCFLPEVVDNEAAESGALSDKGVEIASRAILSGSKGCVYGDRQGGLSRQEEGGGGNTC